MRLTIPFSDAFELSLALLFLAAFSALRAAFAAALSSSESLTTPSSAGVSPTSFKLSPLFCIALRTISATSCLLSPPTAASSTFLSFLPFFFRSFLGFLTPSVPSTSFNFICSVPLTGPGNPPSSAPLIDRCSSLFSLFLSFLSSPENLASDATPFASGFTV